MEYITKILGAEVTRMKWEQTSKLPYFLQDKYHYEAVSIAGMQCLFLKPAGELEAINVIKKHLRRLREVCQWPFAFELITLSRQRRTSFIEAKIGFVVPGKHVYLPFLGIQLQDRADSEAVGVPILEKLQPSAQMLLFAFILAKNEPMYLSEMTRKFGFSAMTLSRAASQLTQVGLVNKINDGVQKVLASDMKPQELYEKARPYLINPIRRTIFISKAEVTSEMFCSGLSALAERSMLNPPMPEVWGTVQSAKLFPNAMLHLLDAEKQCALELWKYDPRLICGDRKTDALSLAVSLKSMPDERIQQMLDQMLREVW